MLDEALVPMSDGPTFDECLKPISDEATLGFGGSIVAMVEPNKHAMTAATVEDFMINSKLDNDTGERDSGGDLIQSNPIQRFQAT
jgi:hypothetical protein